jgi:hypothetical protein
VPWFAKHACLVADVWMGVLASTERQTRESISSHLVGEMGGVGVKALLHVIYILLT